MKKISIIIASICLVTSVFGQTRNLKTADRNLKNGKLDKAYDAIKLAMDEPENTDLWEAWFSKARIYTAIAASTDLKYTALADDQTIPTAYEAFKKAIEMDQSGNLKLVFAHPELTKLSNASYQKGTDFFSAKAYADAAKAFEYSYKSTLLVDVIDTNALYNVALCADLGGDKDLAEKSYLEVIRIGGPFSSAYTSLANIYKDKGDKENAIKYADMAVSLFPDDYNTLINAASIHLMLENSERAQEILTTMAERFNDNKVVFFALGASYMQNDMYEEAKTAYERALQLDPEYFDVIFNMGVLYVNQGIGIRQEADALPLSEQKKYDELTEKANDSFRNAIPYLEKALTMKPGDIPVMSTLKDLYVQLRMMDKANEMTAEIEKLEQK